MRNDLGLTMSTGNADGDSERQEHATRRDAGATRRDVPQPGDGDAPETRRDSPEEAGGEQLLRLPASLAERFTLVDELASVGAEADVVRVRGADGDYVLKLYRRGFRASREVWDKLARLDSPHLLHIHETGTAADRDFELLEHITHGDLETLVGPDRPVLSAELVGEVVGQLAGALETLHAAGVVHRDLKPANVLVRNLFPLELAVADFGLSKSLEESQRYTTTSRTVAYAPPEALWGRVSAAWDWWSLGMIIRQLATGERPFANVSEAAVIEHLTTRPIDVDGVADERARLLCRGLLVKDPEQRWGGEQVQAWLDGGSPEVPEEVEPADGHSSTARQALVFNGVSYVDRESLALALAEDWPTASRRFFTNMGTYDTPSEAWRLLRDWLAQFDDPQTDDVEGRIELVDQYLMARLPPDVKLARLLRWLHPNMPPVYRGNQMTRADVAELASQALGGDRAATQTVDTLWQHEVLALLAGFTGGEELATIERQWRDLCQKWEELPPKFAPQVRQSLEQQPARYALLQQAAAADDSLANWTWSRRQEVTEDVSWFGALVRDAEQQQDTVLLLATGWAVPYAAQDAERIARERQEREERWDQREDERLDGRGQALRSAAVGLVWLLVALAAVGLSMEFVLYSRATSSGENVLISWIPGWSTSYYWIASLPAAAVAVVAEIWLAWTLGFDYLGQPLGGSLKRAVRFVTGRSWLLATVIIVITMTCLFIIALAMLFTTLLWLPLPLVVVIGSPFYARLRYRRWSNWVEEYKREVLEES